MTEWWQGDYVDDAGLCDDGGACERADGVGIEYGIGPSDAKGIEDAPMQRFEIGRHIRINTPNITKIEGGEGEEDQWYYGEPIRGEGMYECFGGTRRPRRVRTCKDGPADSTVGRRSVATSSTRTSRLRRVRTVVSVKEGYRSA